MTGRFCFFGILLIFTLAFCSCSHPKSTDNPPPESFDSAPEVTIIFDNPQDAKLRDLGVDLYDNPWYRYIYDRIGVRPRVVWVPSKGYLSKIRLMIASKESFEVFRGDHVSTWIRENGIVPLDDLLEMHGQDILESAREDAIDAVSYRGEIYGVPIPEHRIVKHLLLIRKDWCEKLGVAVPGTISEFENFLKLVRTHDLDGNGLNDEYGISFDMDFSDTLALSGAFGVPAWYEKGSYVDFDAEEIVFWSTTDNARRFYAAIARWWRQGLIDPESLSQDRYVGQKPKFVNGKIGSIRDSLLDIPVYERKIFENTGVIPEIEPVPPLQGLERNGYMKNSIIDRAFFINTYADQKSSAVQFLNFFAAEEGRTFVSRGIAGNGDGIEEIPNAIKAERKMLEIFSRFVPMTKKEYWESLQVELTDLYGRYLNRAEDVERRVLLNRIWHMKANEEWGYSGYTDWHRDILITDLDAAIRYPDPLSEHAEYRLKFLVGELDAMNDKHWNQYIEALTTSGIFKVYQAAAKKWFDEVYEVKPERFSRYNGEG